MPHYRAEILTIFGSYFGRNDDFINSFWNLLTFRKNCFQWPCPFDMKGYVYFINNFSVFQLKRMQEVAKKVAHGKMNRKTAMKCCQIILFCSKIILRPFNYSALFTGCLFWFPILVYDSASYRYKAKSPKVKAKTKGSKKFFT